MTSLDTKAAAAGQCSIVVSMARLLEQHLERTVKQAADAAEDLIDRSQMCFIPNEPEYLRAGGRVINATALCGKILSIHPLIEIKDGYLVAAKN